jgi:NAD(P)-dependent dehydrogenase (short-subunit alcohol dehydrogenase family)
MAVARRFARGGFRVAAVARPGDPRTEFQAALEAEARGPEGAGSDARAALVLGAHLAEERALADACAAIQAWGGLPEVLVWNASAGIQCPAADLEPARLLEDFRVNVGAPLEAVQWALPAMRRAGRGTLLFTGGGLALAPKPGLAAAAMGKAALRSLALSLAGELAPEGIHAATVTVRGFVQAGTPLAPDAIAQVFWEIHLENKASWTPERILP